MSAAASAAGSTYGSTNRICCRLPRSSSSRSSSCRSKRRSSCRTRSPTAGHGRVATGARAGAVTHIGREGVIVEAPRRRDHQVGAPACRAARTQHAVEAVIRAKADVTLALTSLAAAHLAGVSRLTDRLTHSSSASHDSPLGRVRGVWQLAFARLQMSSATQSTVAPQGARSGCDCCVWQSCVRPLQIKSSAQKRPLPTSAGTVVDAGIGRRRGCGSA